MKSKPVLNVVKVGGNVINNQNTYNTFLKNFAALLTPKILIHGGGNKATQLSEKMGITTQVVAGRRITNTETLEVVTMSYAGLINKDVVSRLQSLNCNALGLSGADGNSIEALKRNKSKIDYGFVGDIVKVNTNFLKSLLGVEIIPVFCSITHDKKGQLLNTNGDTLAMEIAAALAIDFEVALYYCFDKPGVLMDKDDAISVIPFVNSKTYETLLKTQKVTDGMQPKMSNGFEALKRGVKSVSIGNEHLLSIQLTTPYTQLEL